MRKKITIICLAIFMLIGFLFYDKTIISEDGVILAMTLDGSSITELPGSVNDRNYRVSIKCENAIGTWLPEEWNFVVEEIKGTVKCNLDFITITENDALKLEVEKNTINVGTAKTSMVDATYTSLELDDYKNYKITYSSSLSGGGTTSSTVFEYDSGVWTSSSIASGYYGKIAFDVPEDGLYRVCYSIPSSADGYNTANKLYFYSSEKQIGIIAVSSTAINNECLELGALTSDDNLKVVQYSKSTMAPISFYVQKTSDIEIVNAGNRYTGKEPNNYIWFNNELWRIIGSIPTCTALNDDETCVSTENLVKIIRNESIGGLAYDAKSSGYTGDWGANTLYTLLNDYYYGKKNGTGTDYCYGNSATSVGNCDYRIIGIGEETYYGKMIKSVYWSTGNSHPVTTAIGIYGLEMSRQIVSGKVGAMSASDYGYASSNEYYNSFLNVYNTKDIISTNWLYKYPNELTIIESLNNIIFTSGYTGISTATPNSNFSVRPVVYLDSDVYVVSGDGSITNPYQIAMPS